MEKTRVLIMGAAGKDFHVFLTLFKHNPKYEVVCFTATQIPGIEKRGFPKELAGSLYSKDIPVYPEEKLPELIKKHRIDEVVFAYSDVSNEYIAHKEALVNSCGADFRLPGTEIMIKSKKPVIAVTSIRTGCGKSQTSRKIVSILREKRKRVVVLRHPMPYGDLVKQAVQRFEIFEDLDKHDCTIEEREEYEPHIENGAVVFAGVDYKKIVEEAEREADIILWDGGNNDIPFIKPGLWITVVDPLRPGHELDYYPGELNLRMADVVIINKENSAEKEDIEIVARNIKSANPDAEIIHADSVISVGRPELVRNKQVVVVEDGPTLTHGGMKFGAGIVAANKFHAKVVDPKPFAAGSIKATLENFELENLIPAMGYSREQVKELEETINKTKADAVLSGTPIDLNRIIKVNKPVIRVRYELEEIKKPGLAEILKKFV